MKHIRVSGQYQPCTNLNFFLLRLCWHWHSRVEGGHASLCQERPGVITGVKPCTWFGVTTWFGVITWLGVITWPGVITGVRPCTWLWPGGLETNLATWRFFLFHTYRLFPHFRLHIVIHGGNYFHDLLPKVPWNYLVSYKPHKKLISRNFSVKANSTTFYNW